MAANPQTSSPSYRDIRVWQYAMQLAVDTYQIASQLPPGEKPGLATHLQQVTAAIPALIANGHRSGSRHTMLANCERALLYADELDTLLVITGQLHPSVPSNDLVDQLDEVRNMLATAIARLANKTAPTNRKTV